MITCENALRDFLFQSLSFSRSIIEIQFNSVPTNNDFHGNIWYLINNYCKFNKIVIMYY